MKIYIDFDDVLCETARYFTKIAKEHFGIDVPYREVQFFNLQKSFDLTDEQYDELMRIGHLPETLLAYEEAPGASDTIRKWAEEGHEISVVTGRPFSAYEPSRQWLDQHHLEDIPLYCVDKYGRENVMKNSTYNLTLADLYQMQFDLAIEDSPAAFEHVLHFPNCRVAVYDRPWNQAAEFPNAQFVRCGSWDEIAKLASSFQPKYKENIKMELHDFTAEEQQQIKAGLSEAVISDKEAAGKILALVPEEWISGSPSS